MGIWATPHSSSAVSRLEKAMETPVTPQRFTREFYDLVGDDTLSDTIDEAAEKDPSADVRPLISATLEDWGRWRLTSDWIHPWEPGTAERVAFLAEKHAGDISELLPKLAVEDVDVVVSMHLCEILGEQAEQHDVLRIIPGVYAIFDPTADKLFRVECINGLVNEAPDAIAGHLKQALFPVGGPALAH